MAPSGIFSTEIYSADKHSVLMRAQKPILTNAEKPRYPKFLTTPAAI
jgi:hypothetical protein